MSASSWFEKASTLGQTQIGLRQRFIFLLLQAAALLGSDASRDGVKPASSFVIGVRKGGVSGVKTPP